MELNKRVLLGMSGGTDSSVAAMLLKEAGYEVVGVTFRFYEFNDSTEYLEDARHLAEQLKIKHIIYDARSIFRTTVVDYFIREYMSGHTPVPCTFCNNLLKWPLLKRIADENDIFYISTGHYVQVRKSENNYYICCGSDEEKDQSFFLWGLGQDILSRILLPLGNMTKIQVRKFAADRGFSKVATKKDSLGVCFCPMDYRNFLRQELGEEKIIPGNFIDENGCFIARHEGFPFYTVGQRRGLGVHLNRAVFVKEIIPELNVVVLANLKALEQQEMYLKDWNIIEKKNLLEQEGIIVKIRYRKQSNRCIVSLRDNGLLHIYLYEPLTAIAIGQAAAFYRGDVLLGGGIICDEKRLSK